MAYPTDDPIRKLILANVKSTLEGIGTPTYRTDVRDVEHVALNSQRVKTYPFVAIGPPSYVFDDSRFRRIEVEMNIALLLVIYTSTDPVGKMQDFFEDVSLALRSDVTRGGYALDTHIRAESPEVPDINDQVFSTEIEVQILYRHLNTDPSSAL